jgi:hypothetical protein
MLGGAREFRYDWILLRARNLPHEAGGTPAPIILRGGKRLAVRPARLSAGAVLNAAMTSRRFPPPWSVEELDACFVVHDHSGQKLAAKLLTKHGGGRG